jgi:AmiR/NasT family two-component response regulator
MNVETAGQIFNYCDFKQFLTVVLALHLQRQFSKVKSEKILVIEDEMIISEHITEMLQELGYENITCAHSAEKATDLLSRNAYTVILADIHLGKGPDVIDVINNTKLKKKTPVIFLTGKSSRNVIEKARTSLPVAFITKPITQTNLRVQMEMFTGRKKKQGRDQE